MYVCIRVGVCVYECTCMCLYVIEDSTKGQSDDRPQVVLLINMALFLLILENDC